MSTAAIVLAAGLSRRMAPRNKLLLTDSQGVAMVARVADALLASSASPIIVVTGHQAPLVREALGRRPLTIAEAPDFATGMAASLRAGIEAVPAGCRAALICLGDMPRVGPTLIDRLIGAHDPAQGRFIVVPTVRGTRGNPVLWDRRYFAEIRLLQGDAGARSLLVKYAADVAELPCTDESSLTDFDTQEALPFDAGAA